jgi:hypothetical protein
MESDKKEKQKNKKIQIVIEIPPASEPQGDYRKKIKELLFQILLEKWEEEGKTE